MVHKLYFNKAVRKAKSVMKLKRIFLWPFWWMNHRGTHYTYQRQISSCYLSIKSIGCCRWKHGQGQGCELWAESTPDQEPNGALENSLESSWCTGTLRAPLWSISSCSSPACALTHLLPEHSAFPRLPWCLSGSLQASSAPVTTPLQWQPTMH